MNKNSKGDCITVKIHGTEEVWYNRDDAIFMYEHGAETSQGLERERYLNIIADLKKGLNYCTDTMIRKDFK